VVTAVSPCSAEPRDHRDDIVHRAQAAHHAFHPQATAFMRERAHRDAPAAVQFVDEVFTWHFHRIEKHLGEFRLAGEVAQRPDLNAGRIQVDQQHGNAPVFWRVLVGAHVTETLGGDHRVTGPDLLAGHHEMIARVLRAGAERREVGPGARLGHADAPHGVAANRGGRHRLLLRVAKFQQRRADNGIAAKMHRAADTALRECFEVEQRLRRRRIATAQVRRVGGNHPAVVEQRGLPGLRPRRDHHHAVVIDVVRADPVARDLRFGRAVLLQKVE
jgi:hypothetical protein